MAYRIFVSSFQCESNTFCKTFARLEDFEISRGEVAVNKLAASAVFRENGMELVAGVFASALPSGRVSRDAFEHITGDILEGLKSSGRVDGVYLYLHGAMCVQELGSGEEQLVARIRETVGGRVPLALALDFHADNTDALLRNVNIVEGFRTAPHTDQDETERRAALGLVRCLREGVLPQAVFVRVPILAADAAVTASPPLKDIMEGIGALDKDQRVYSAAFFNGQPWVDAPYAGGCAVVTTAAKDEEVSLEAARQLADIYWRGRALMKLGGEAMSMDEALAAAAAARRGPLFVTDSGDNTTAGAEGAGTLMLRKVLEHGLKDVLVCGVTAPDAVAALKDQPVGAGVDFWVGTGEEDPIIVPVRIYGRIKSSGKVLGWAGQEYGVGVVIAMQGVDVVLTDVRAAFISVRHIESMGVRPSDYKTVVVKLGYLFPGLQAIAAGHIFALTPGASTNLFDTLDYRHIRRPMYPLDKDFEWKGIYDEKDHSAAEGTALAGRQNENIQRALFQDR